MALDETLKVEGSEVIEGALLQRSGLLHRSFKREFHHGKKPLPFFFWVILAICLKTYKMKILYIHIYMLYILYRSTEIPENCIYIPNPM